MNHESLCQCDVSMAKAIVSGPYPKRLPNFGWFQATFAEDEDNIRGSGDFQTLFILKAVLCPDNTSIRIL